MNDFEAVLRQFDTTLMKYNQHAYRQLGAPLPEADIEQKMAQLGLKDEQLKAWFEWKTGDVLAAIDEDEDEDEAPSSKELLAQGCYPISLDGILALREAREEDPSWPEQFVPIATDGTGLFLLFNSAPGEDYGMIYLYSASLLKTDPESCYDSLQAMMETTIRAYEEGILSYNEDDDWLEEDFDRYYPLAKEINVRSAYWTNE